MLIAGVKDTIDAGQNKREIAFNKEDYELTDKILSYIDSHPQASEREVAKAVGCSNGKVNKVRQKYLSSNITNNDNSNSNLNNNGVSISVSKTPRISPKRLLEDLSEEELDTLLKKFKKRTPYEDLYKEFKLSDGIVSKDLGNEITEEREKRKQKAFSKKVQESYSNCSNNDLVFLSEHLDCNISEAVDNALKLNYPLDVLKNFFTNHAEVFNKKYYHENYSADYPTYFDFLKNSISINT